MKNKSFNKSKKSQTDVIITVLLILVGLVGVSFVAVFGFNFIKENLTPVQNADIYLDSSSMIPFYYNVTSEVYVVVGRGTDDANLSGVVLIVSNKGNSKSFKYNIAPSTNERKLYSVGPFNSKPDFIAVAAIVISGEKEKILAASEKFEIIESNQFFSNIDTNSGFVGNIDLPPEPKNVTSQ